MDEEILSVLETRVAQMEKQVFGTRTSQPQHERTDSTIADALINSHTMITSALSCRDNIVKVLQRLPELNTFLDPTYPEHNVEIEAKKQYIFLLYPQLRDLANVIHEFNRVQAMVDSKAISKVPEMSDKLDTIMGNYVNTYLDSAEVTKNVHGSINKYNDILANLEVLMMQFDKTAAEIEYEMKPKRPSTAD